MSEFNYKNKELFIEEFAASDLTKEYGTPLFVYSLSAISTAYETYRKAFASLNPLICYAVKANGNLSILRYFASIGAGFDIVSGGELARVLAAGGQANKIIYSGVGKTQNEIQMALKAQIRCFNVESISELLRLNDIAGEMSCIAPISLRVNPDVDAKTHPYISTGLRDNKFGISIDQALAVYQQAAKLPNLQIIGIDCHIGSQLLDTSPMIDALDRLLILVDELQISGIQLEHIDLGGGIGIRYQEQDKLPDLSDYAAAIAKRLDGRRLKLMLEPGRSLVGESGVLLTRVEYIKQSSSKRFAIVDAAMNDLIRPSLYDAYHQVLPTKQHNSADIETELFDVVGPICESGDFLAKDCRLAIKEGDFLAIKSVGAYGFSMSSNYNARARAAEVLVSGSKARLINNRENIEDLLINEKKLLNRYDLEA